MLLQQQAKEPEVSNNLTDSTERLRQILASRLNRTVSYDDATEVGCALVEFYELLAEDSPDEAVC